MSDYPTRPQTPQAMLHRLPDKPDASSKGSTEPPKYIILIEASTAVAGKVQIAKSVSDALCCPLFQGDSLHETSAKAASVGGTSSGANEARYQRMWLSKMTRTGHLFPGASRAANEGFAGFGGVSSTSTSRRGSGSSAASASSPSDAAGSVSISSVASRSVSSDVPTMKYIDRPLVLTLSEEEKLRKVNPVLMVVTHPELETWHRDSIRKAVGDYGIGVIFVPLYEVEELPVLKPLDPRTMTSFASPGAFEAAPKGVFAVLEGEIVLRVDVMAKVEKLVEDIVGGVREILRV